MIYKVRNNEQYPSIKEYLAENSYVGYFGYITKGLQDLSEIMPDNFENLSCSARLGNVLFRRSITVNKPALSITHSWYDNFYHFVWESLVKLYCLRNYIGQSTVVFPQAQSPYHKEWLSLLGVQDITLIKKREKVKTSLAISASFLTTDMPDHKSILEGFRDWVIFKLKKNGLLEDKSKYPQKIYINRSKVRYRKVVNNEEVIKLVENKGYKVVELEDYSLAQQINLFYHADDILGVHGAGFAHIGFTKAPVLDIIVDTFNSQWFSKLAETFGTKYDFIRMTGVANDYFRQTPGYLDIRIDLVKLEKYIDYRYV